MSDLLFPLLTFLAVVLAIFGAYSLLSDLFLRDRRKVQDRLDAEFHSKQRERAKKSLQFKDLQSPRGEVAEGAKTPSLSIRQRLQAMLDQSGLELTLQRLFSYSAIAALVAGLAVGMWLRSPLAGLLAAAVGTLGPFLYVHFKRNARLEAIRQQLSDAFDLMARILRAGQSMAQAMQGVATEFSSPIAEEFAYCSEQQNLGLSTEISMRDLSRRTGLVEMNIFVVAVLVQRQVGGNLSEILEKLAQVVRERYKTRGLIRGLTAEGRMQAGVLMALPPLLFVAMLIVNYEYAKVLLEQPVLLWGMVFFMGVGGLWIRKIVNFDF
ncbi:MAG TPA: type II secretion system F family protein [Pirellulaceae bacterium]|nr:type II secretion system F family protein [Pirellulaceae bacterium]